MSGEERKSKDFLCIVPRGFLKTYLLEILSEGPVHGYAIMEKIQKMTGFWKPSPGTIYPLLNSLVKDGYAEVLSQSGRRKEYKLTLKGRKLHKEVRETKYLLSEKISGVLSQMTPKTKAEIKSYFESEKNGCANAPVIYQMHAMFTLLFRLSKSPEKTPKASQILIDTNLRLAKLLGEGGRR